MATSRYLSDPKASTGSGATDNKVSGMSSATSQGSSSQQTSGTSTTTQNQTQTTDSTTRNMTSAQQRILDNLLKQLAAGGTPEMQQQTATRNAEISTVRSNRDGYSKEAAFGDAQGLISQQMRRVLEQLMPGINRASEDAGSSGGALRALLLQDAASKAAEASSALGVQTATNYGNVSANLSQVLERLVAGGDQATQALLQALGVAKGATSTTQGTVNTSGTSTTNSAQTQTGSTSSSQQGTENKVTDYAPFQMVDTTPQVFGVVQTPTTSAAGSTLHNLEQLAGLSSPWNSYNF